jgi:hypothetical protein
MWKANNASHIYTATTAAKRQSQRQNQNENLWLSMVEQPGAGQIGCKIRRGAEQDMGVVEEVRQVIQDFLAPELREIRVRLDAMDEINRVRHDYVIQRLEQIQQSFAFDKRISNLEAEKTHSA